MEYKIVYSPENNAPGYIWEIERKVKWAMAEGWRPQGGLVVIGTDRDRSRFYQAMVREEGQ